MGLHRGQESIRVQRLWRNFCLHFFWLGCDDGLVLRSNRDDHYCEFPGCIACALLAINNIRDREKDALFGKRTLAVRLGDRNSRNFFVALLVIAHTAALLTLTPWALITLALLPLTFRLSKLVRSDRQGLALIPLLAKTGQLQLLFAGLFATALWLS